MVENCFISTLGTYCVFGEAKLFYSLKAQFMRTIFSLILTEAKLVIHSLIVAYYLLVVKG